jgi:hypothetical protein
LKLLGRSKAECGACHRMITDDEAEAHMAAHLADFRAMANFRLDAPPSAAPRSPAAGGSFSKDARQGPAVASGRVPPPDRLGGRPSAKERRYQEYTRALLRELRADGWTVPDLAQKTGASVPTIWRLLKLDTDAAMAPASSLKTSGGG